ncbi:unnamed protein product [Peronospora farinosa]|uniref:Uncharacterized protein n=1 Tax=Peronospora farinosa TaxID=134698 RepID=A0AAV0UYK2_9STRA|nr:unnamed protein product [Peronospora farinosa]CAI5740725.1 unnamed protein product [Peronospora farinosa]
MKAIRSFFTKTPAATSRSEDPDSPFIRPPTVSWILQHRAELQNQKPSTRGRTPLASLYRICEYFVVGDTAGIRAEVEFFFNQPSWALNKIPDPEDPDPERYAVLAVLPYYMAQAFKRLIERGLPRDSPAIIMGDAAEAELRSKAVVLEKEPEWVSHVPKLKKTLMIPDCDGNAPAEDARSDKFMDMNIIAEAPYILFV